MIYRLRYFGGPKDGMEVMSLRPLDRIIEPTGETYAATVEGEKCLIWLSDDERAIELHHVKEKKHGI